jgi:glycosyltransferase involved in cell wall biosynthesis
MTSDQSHLGSRPELSLIVCTVMRTEPLIKLLASLCAQRDRDFEVIVVDQNEGNEVEKICERYSKELFIRHVRSPRGLSRARNVGLRFARACLVGFPDDDCWYDPDVTGRVRDEFRAMAGYDLISGMCRDAEGVMSNGRFDPIDGDIDPTTVWARTNSNTIFCRTNAARDVGGFDESLGVGAGTRWGSGEETDFVLRLIASGSRCRYNPALVVRHPQQGVVSAAASKRRAVPYARGYMHVLLLHNYPRRALVRAVLRPLLGALYHLVRLDLPRAALSFWSSMGRLQEWAVHRCGR